MDSWNKIISKVSEKIESRYEYDEGETGQQLRQSGRGATLNYDGFEGYTAGTIEQNFIKFKIL